MSTHFLIDAHTDPIGDSPVKDVRLSTTTSPMNGNFVVRVSPGTRITSQPSVLSDLLTQKIDGILEQYRGFGVAGFPQIEYSHMLDSSDIIFPGAGDSVNLGERFGCLLAGNNIETVNRNVSGPVTSVIVLVEWFDRVLQDPKDGVATYYYTEQDHSGPREVDVSMDNKANYETDIQLGVPVTTVNAGSDLSLRFSTGGSRAGLGFWAIIY